MAEDVMLRVVDMTIGRLLAEVLTAVVEGLMPEGMTIGNVLAEIPGVLGKARPEADEVPLPPGSSA